MHLFRRLLLIASFALVAIVAVTGASAGSGGTGVSGTATVEPQLIDDASLKASTTTDGGADVTPTSRTIPHWHGTATDPNNGVTYGFNMVGADPNNCSGSACSCTVEADITPLVVNIDGLTFDGNAVVSPVLASPLFSNNDYGSTPAATAAGAFPNSPAFIQGPGGVLSQGDAGQQLQLEDATMRAQFNKTGSSPYHLKLHANVLPSVTIDVPKNQGTLIVSGRGVVGADIDVGWWSSKIHNLESKADPTHLPIYLTDQVLLYDGNDPSNCCIIGYHGTRGTGNGGGSPNSNGNAKVQTFAWASWVQPGFYARPAGGTDWALQDIHALSHEISEWRTIRSSTTPSSRGRRRSRRSTGAPACSRRATRSWVSASPRGRTRSSRGRTRTARRAPTGTTTRRTRCSHRGGPQRLRTGHAGAMSSQRRILLLAGVLAVALVVAIAAIALGGGSKTAKNDPTVTTTPSSSSFLAGVPQHGATLGSPSAPATVNVFEDPQCPYCREWSLGALPSAVAKYVKTGRVKLVWEGIPIIGQNSLAGLTAAYAAGNQNKLWNLVDQLYQRQGAENSGWITESTLRGAAAAAGIDADQMLKDAQTQPVASQITAAETTANNYRVGGTPTFVLVTKSGKPKTLQLTSLSAAAFDSALSAALG